MVNLQGQPAELRMMLQITRAETGKVDEVELVGFVDEDVLKEFLNGSNPLDGSPQRSD